VVTGPGHFDHPGASAQTVVHPGHRPGGPGGSGPGSGPPGSTPPPLPAPQPPSPDRRSRRLPLIAIGVVVALLASLAVVGVLVFGRSGTTTTTAEPPPVSPVVPASAWRTLRADPTPRQQVATTVADGTVWVIGGITQGAASNLMEGYDPAIDTWKTGIPLPVGLSHEMAVTYRGEIVVLGGWEAQGGNLTAVSSKKVYAQRGGGWVELPPMLSSHVAGGAVVVGDQIIVSGGQADGKLNPTTEVFDGTAWKRVSDLPTPREHLGMATDGNFAYVVGGRDLSSDKNSSALERYDPKTDSWAALAAMPAPRGGIGAAVADGRLVVAGGEEPTSVDNSVYAYDIASNTWSDLPPLPTGRHGLAVAAVDKTIFAIGGATQASHTASTGVGEALQIPPRRLQPAPVWRPLKDAPVARQFTGTTVAGGKMWVLGGLTQDAATPAVYGYDPAIDTWTRGPDLPLQLHHLAAVTYRDELVVIGGWAPANGNLSGLVSGKVFALRNGAWVELAPLTHPRVAHAAAVVGDKIVVVGGQADNQLVAPTEVFDGTKWTDAAPIPTPREHLSATTDGTYVYAVGGRNLSSDKNTAAFERFDPATGAWQTMPNMPTPRGGVAAAFVDGRIVAAGGEEPTRVLPTVEAYDVATGTWSPLPSLPVPRHGISLATVGNSVYAVGGAQRPTHAKSAATVEALDFS
jgi:non-specific serine/threonine protein kinase